jgi:D-aminoacyl-tRNA deacylase
MKYAVIVSKQDQAGMNIAKHIVERDDLKLFIREEESIHCENIDKEIDAEMFIFATKHESAAGKPALSVHFPGNFSKAEMGGKDKTLCKTNASLEKEFYLKLKELHEGTVTLEVTHHGPYLEKPCIFIEIGSTEKEWVNEEYGKIIAQTICEVTKEVKQYKTLVGIGGGHYSVTFGKVLERTEYAIAHICPKYQLENLDESLLKQMLSSEKVEFVVVDWKGLGQYKEKVKQLLEGVEWKKARQVVQK